MASFLVAAVACLLPLGCGSQPSGSDLLLSSGVTTDGHGDPVAVATADPGSWITDTSLFRGSADSPTAAAVDAQRRWLRQSRFPGGDRPTPTLARALLDLHALTEPNGAFLAGAVSQWRYVWPRDSAFAAAALAVTGHERDAYRILRFLQQVAPSDGRWQARYLPDGSGRVPDDRGVELDGGAWVIWASWLATRQSSTGASKAQIAQLYPMISASADALERSIGADGLPAPSDDYWEHSEKATTIEIAASAAMGLRAASRIGADVLDRPSALRWARAADKLDTTISHTFGTTSYQRYATSGGADTGVVFLGPPFAPPNGAVERAITASYQRLLLPNGGVQPGQGWKHPGIAWTPETALFALSFAATNDLGRAQHIDAWLASHATSLGEVPEQVSASGRPASVAPLGWTSALQILTAVELKRPLTLP